MATAKSPFLVIRNFLSPKMCEQFVDSYGFHSMPDRDADDTPIKMVRHADEIEESVFSRFEPMIPNLETYYDFEYRGTEEIMLEYYATGASSVPACENSSFQRSKWARTRDRDFTVIVFLSDTHSDDTFDNDYEVYGGKYEFPQHNFGFQAERGTMIVYPSGPHFINNVAPVIAGDLYMIKYHFTGKMPFIYQPTNFPGDMTSWFDDIG